MSSGDDGSFAIALLCFHVLSLFLSSLIVSTGSDQRPGTPSPNISMWRRPRSACRADLIALLQPPGLSGAPTVTSVVLLRSATAVARHVSVTTNCVVSNSPARTRFVYAARHTPRVLRLASDGHECMMMHDLRFFIAE